jgi:hypothetical protein
LRARVYAHLEAFDCSGITQTAIRKKWRERCITCNSRHAALILAPPPPRDLTEGLMQRLARDASDTQDLRVHY